MLPTSDNNSWFSFYSAVFILTVAVVVGDVLPDIQYDVSYNDESMTSLNLKICYYSRHLSDAS